MTWGPSSVSFVECNNTGHQGNRVSRIDHGAAISCLQAIKADGWHYNQRTQQHVCPACVRTLSRRN